MKTILRSQGGLTLTEVMVSGIVGAIIAGMILSVFTMQNSALSEGTANSRMQMQANVVSDQIGRKVRSGNLVLAPGETWSASPVFASARDTTYIMIDSANGHLLAAYRISGSNLQDSSSGAHWANFSTGGTTVTVASGSTFHLTQGRKEVTLNLQLTTTYKGRSYTMAKLGDMYRCRN